MMKLLRLTAPVLLACALAPAAQAQVRPSSLQAPLAHPDSALAVRPLLPDSLAAVPAPVDSARLAWLRTPPQLRDLVGDRIGCLETDVPHVFNDHVMSFVKLFTERQRGYTQRVLERENLYFPLFEKYLAKYDLPLDLKYLAVVESALIPTAKSRVGATGLWQLMGPTANDLRLRRDDWVDERMDPEKATEAACKHLRYLYKVFGDWEMVLAAYNWGAGSMQRVVKRTGKKTYWEVHPNLPAETRNYVPTFTAIMYTMKYAREHELLTPTLNYRYAQTLDTLQLGGQPFDLTRLAQAIGSSDSLALLRLNPELRKSYLPAGYRPYALKVPAAARPALAVASREVLFDYCRPLAELPQPLAPRLVALGGIMPLPARSLATTTPPPAATPRFERLRHTVKRGETVNSVAARYDVSPAQVRRWNKLGTGSSLAGRQQLVLLRPLPAVAATAVKTPMVAVAAAQPAVALVRVAATKVATPAATTAPALVPEALAGTPAKQAADVRRTVAAVAAAVVADSVPGRYVVKPGDFLEKIATANGLTVAQLKAWNQLDSYVLQPGQELTLTVPATATPTEAVATLIGATRETATVVQVPMRRPSRPTAVPPASPPAPPLYLVQPGDTLYNISRRYQGLTVERLKQLNNLKSDAVQPGQKLVVGG